MAKELPVTETYEEVKGLIFSICHKFKRLYGGDFEEMVSEANVVFMKAYKGYDIRKGSVFGTYLYTSIWNHLSNWRNFEARRRHTRSVSLSEKNGVLASHVAPKLAEYDRQSFLEELSDDAATVLELVFDSPQEIIEIATAKGRHPMNWSSTIRAYLRDIGWTGVRVIQSFNEIKEALR